MKKIFLFSLGLSMVFLISCTEDLINNLTNDLLITPLVGTWNASEITKTGCTDDTQNGVETCSANVCVTITIAADGTYTLIDNFENPTSNESGTITVTTTTVNLCPTGETNCEDDNYVVSGDTLTISFMEDESPGCTFTVVLTRQ